ncbi:hypothetical protein ACIQCD_10500 [Streptomyces sp. NPDC093250]|uniref:hypothetical protein n=1 Tax=Streptomyces sp. NPDC093250 TaxID=3366036 RepID=UPI0037FD3B8E
MRVPLRLIAPVLLAVAGAMASTAPATAVPNPIATITCLTDAAGVEPADPATLLDPADLFHAEGPVTTCLAP